VDAVSVSQTDRPDTGEGDPPRRKPRHNRRRQFSPFVLVLALVFFFTPMVALAGGFRAHEIENRPLAKFPSVHDGWKAFPELGTWATDHLFGRKQAVAANTEISQNLFDQQASNTGSTEAGGYPQVIQGKDGWLFLGDDVQIRCTTHTVATNVVARMKRLSGLITASGRKFLVMIAPDKTSVYPQYLPKNYLGRDCAPPYTANFWSAFDRNPTPGYVDARTPLINAAKSSEIPLYRPKDTHWDMEGISIEAQLLGNALDPALATGTHVADQGTYSPVGDLTYLLGRAQKDVLPARPLVRDGVTMTAGSDLTLNRNKLTHITNTSTGAPLYQPKTLILGDSFTDTSKQYIAPYFANLSLLHNRSTVLNMANAMAANSTVILQMAERLAITGNDLLLSDAALATFAKVLAAHPIKK
jgi:alginate O-acetyltransferase complex protein AlgJ